jgi:chromate transporter
MTELRSDFQRREAGAGDPAPAGFFYLSELPAPPRSGSAAEVLRVSLQLGFTSFGGPIAHIGYFERIYVQKKRWLNHSQFLSLVAMCQLLPGPTSSQVGFLIGRYRAGWLGALAAWVGFTLPSGLLMYAFAMAAARVHGAAAQVIMHGLMLTAAAVVAQALWSMARNLCPDWQRLVMALAAAALLYSMKARRCNLQCCWPGL